MTPDSEPIDIEAVKARLQEGDWLMPSTLQHLELFEYKHLPPHLQAISKTFHDLAWGLADIPTERYAQREYCLYRLLEAKDAAVRMGVPLGEIGSNSPPLRG